MLFFSKTPPGHFDEKKWEIHIKHPDWYLKLLPDYKRLLGYAEKNPSEKKAVKERVFDFFSRHLYKDLVLGESGPDWDKERKSIDTIVIHHTGSAPGMTTQTLNIMHLLRIYAIYYAAPTKQEKYIKGQPVWSNHFRDGKQVFYSYHWMIRMDGSQERLLEDNQVGWHAGNWDINCRSIAICLDNDYPNSKPSDVVLKSIVDLIKNKYPGMIKDRIFGHREINPKTTCPGDLFLNGWKEELLKEF